MMKMNMDRRTPALWINGPEAIGKSTVAFVIFRQLSEAGTKTAFIDLDQVNLCYPAPEDDPLNYRVRAAGLGAVWATFREEGVRCVVISGIAETKEIVKAHTDPISDAQFSIVRLRATPSELKRRFMRRGGDGPQADEAVRVAEEMDRHLDGDLWVNTDGLTPVRIADLVRATAGGWPRLR
jgi:adenylylsulfate kinase-like enzyme